MKAKQGRKKWKTATAIGEWLKRYFNKRTMRKYNHDKVSIFINKKKTKGYIAKEVIDELVKNDDRFIGGPLNG